MLLLEERKGGEEKGVEKEEEEASPFARPLESIWTPCAAERSRGDSDAHPPHKGAAAVTCESSAAIWLSCSVTRPVVSPHCPPPPWRRHAARPCDRCLRQAAAA